MFDMRRREFITLLGGAAAAWPLAARAQQGERIRRIGVVVALAEDDPESVARGAAFEQALQASGWTVGRNIRIEYRWGAFDTARTHCGGGRRARAGRYPCVQQCRARADAASSPYNPDSVYAGHRSARIGVCRKHGAARRQRHRLYSV